MNATGALDQMFGIESTVDLTTVWDVAVVGGGPAGLTAALYAARKNLSTILITLDLGGQVGITHLVTNYPGLPVIEGPELVRLMFEQAYMYGLERLIGERVASIRVDGRAKVLELVSGKEVKARSAAPRSAVSRSPARRTSPAAAWSTAPPATARSIATRPSPSSGAATRLWRRPSR